MRVVRFSTALPPLPSRLLPSPHLVFVTGTWFWVWVLGFIKIVKGLVAKNVLSESFFWSESFEQVF